MKENAKKRFGSGDSAKQQAVVEDSSGQVGVLNCGDGLGRSSGSGRAYPSAHTPDWAVRGGRVASISGGWCVLEECQDVRAEQGVCVCVW